MPDMLKPSELADAIKIILDAGQVPYIEGSPGLGKTDIIKQVAVDLFGKEGEEELDEQDLDYFTSLKPAQRDPVDISGMPVPDLANRVTEWLRPGFMPRSGKGLLFVDEFSAAAPSTQAVLLEFILEHKVGSHALSKEWLVAAAGNSASDRAYATAMGSAMKSRLVHLGIRADVNDWAKWAMQRKKNIMVIAFNRWRTELHHKFDPKSKDNAYCCPRTWTMAADIMDRKPPKALRKTLVAGCVGEAAAVEFEGFLRVFDSLPSIDEIVGNPQGAPVPAASEPATRYAVAAALIDRASERNIEPIYTYAKRLPDELNGMIMLGAIRRKPELRSTGAFVEWGIENGELMA